MGDPVRVASIVAETGCAAAIPVVTRIKVDKKKDILPQCMFVSAKKAGHCSCDKCRSLLQIFIYRNPAGFGVFPNTDRSATGS